MSARFPFLCSLFFQMFQTWWERSGCSFLPLGRILTKKVFVILYFDKCIYILKIQTYFGTAMGEVIEPLFKPGRGKRLTHRENKSWSAPLALFVQLLFWQSSHSSHCLLHCQALSFAEISSKQRLCVPGSGLSQAQEPGYLGGLIKCLLKNEWISLISVSHI